jgi:hypothetical protein
VRLWDPQNPLNGSMWTIGMGAVLQIYGTLTPVYRAIDHPSTAFVELRS